MNITETLFLNIVSRMENGFGELKAEVKASRDASDQGRKDLHKRMDRMEDHTKAEFKEIRSKMERVRIEAAPSATSYLKVASSLLAHWQIIVTILLVIAGVLMGKSPDTIKAWVGAVK